MSIILWMILYVLIGVVILAAAEEKGYVKIVNTSGYILLPIIWLPLCLVLIPYIITRVIIRKIEKRKEKQNA